MTAKKASPDTVVRYAHDVAKDLVLRHRFGKERAIVAVKGDEAYVRKAHAAALPPAYVAQRIALGRSAGQKKAKARKTGRLEGHGASISYPAEARVERKIEAFGGGLIPENFERESASSSSSGRVAGRTEGHLPASAIVCTSGDWQPAVFIPADEMGPQQEDFAPVIGRILSPEQQHLLVEGRGQILTDPRAIASERARAARVMQKAQEWLAQHGEPTNEKDRVMIRKAMTEPRRVERQIERPEVWRKVVEIMRAHKVVASNADNSAWMSGGALFAEESGNEKIESHRAREKRYTATTYASIEASCPTSCVLKSGAGKDKFGRAKLGSCYAQTSNNIYPIVLLLNHIASQLGQGPNEVARSEAMAIDAGFRNGMRRPTDLRIHTSGDTRTREGVAYLAAAAKRMQNKQLWKWIQQGHSVGAQGERSSEGAILKKLTQPMHAWTYTHAWADVRPEAWGIVSTLASVQTPVEAVQAYMRGWAPTIVVPEGFFAAALEKGPSGFYKAFTIPFDAPVHRYRDEKGQERVRPIKYIPCPAQHHDKKMRVGCVNCRLCLNAEGLRASGMGVAFEAHGSGKKSAAAFSTAEEHVNHAHRLVKLPVVR